MNGNTGAAAPILGPSMGMATGGNLAIARTPTSPWLTDNVLFSMAVWWVKMVDGPTNDFATQVTREFNSLVRDLRHELP